MDGVEEAVAGAVIGAAGGAALAAKYGPWWTAPIGLIVGGWLGGIAGMLWGLR